MIHLVRHALAGKRGAFDGPDAERPLSPEGVEQAERIADLLAATPIARIMSSPLLRCVQTVEPLAERLGIAVETPQWLREGSGPDEAAAVARAEAGGIVLCSHGDVLHALVGLLAAEGAPLEPGEPFVKGSVLSLHRLNGRVTGAEYVRL